MLLWERLELDMGRDRAVALVGGGGKTTLLYVLAREAAAAGRTVIITTTTHIRPHPRLPLIDPECGGALRKHLDRCGILLLGRPTPGDRLTGTGEIAGSLRAADVVLIEADGSKGLPLKAPADHEPVLPTRVKAVVAVAGADCVGRAIEAACHRPERVCALLGKPPKALITPEDAAAVLSSPAGGRKGVPEGVRFRCAVNRADLAPRAAEAVRRSLLAQGVRGAVTAFSARMRDGNCLP